MRSGLYVSGWEGIEKYKVKFKSKLKSKATFSLSLNLSLILGDRFFLGQKHFRLRFATSDKRNACPPIRRNKRFPDSVCPFLGTFSPYVENTRNDKRFLDSNFLDLSFVISSSARHEAEYREVNKGNYLLNPSIISNLYNDFVINFYTFAPH